MSAKSGNTPSYMGENPSYMGENQRMIQTKQRGQQKSCKPKPNNKKKNKRNKKLSFRGASIEEEFRRVIFTQFNGMQGVKNLVKVGKDLMFQKLMLKLTEAIKLKM